MKELQLQMKLIKHLNNKDDSRVRDYIIYIRTHYPDLTETCFDMDLLKKACDFLRECGWNLYLKENHNERPSQYIRRS